VTVIRATEIFVPSDFPTVTYVEREDERLEKRVRDALDTPRSPISISGPSKTGKTALVRNIVGDENLIHIFGSQIEAAGDL
jgi:predicted AAA+ superfamily ATPase